MSYFPQELKPLGALCLDYTDDIHRPPGDPLNPDSFAFPLVHAQVRLATVQKVVFSGEFSEDFVDMFAEACHELEQNGAIGVITLCGFLAQVQSRLAAKINIPIATSSLLQVPNVLAVLPQNKMVAILTFDQGLLGKEHFDGVGISEQHQKRLVVYGTKKGGHLKNIIIEGSPYHAEELNAELVALAQQALSDNPTIGAFVLECTQMPPTSRSIQDATGLPVYDVLTMIDWFYTGLTARMMPADPNPVAGLRPRARSAKERG